MGSSLSTPSHVADLEVFPEETKDIILCGNSLNEANPLATEPKPHTHTHTHTHTVEELFCVFPGTCFCAHRRKSNDLFSWAQPADFNIFPKPCGEIE